MRSLADSLHAPSLPADPRAARHSPRRLLTTLESRLRAVSLDSALADGANPSSNPALSHRAAVLTSDRQRERMAEAITRVLAASRRPSRWSSAVAPNRAEVSAAQPLLLRIEGILLSSTPIYCKGVAMLRRLLTDGSSPLYRQCPPHTLDARLENVIAALEGSG